MHGHRRQWMWAALHARQRVNARIQYKYIVCIVQLYMYVHIWPSVLLEIYRYGRIDHVVYRVYMS